MPEKAGIALTRLSWSQPVLLDKVSQHPVTEWGGADAHVMNSEFHEARPIPLGCYLPALM